MCSVGILKKDRGTLSHRRLICKVIKRFIGVRNGFYQLQSPWGILQRQVPFNQLNKVSNTYNFQLAQGVDHQKTITITQACKQFRLQPRIRRCRCKTSSCSSGNCGCRRKNTTCTPNCHGVGTTCENMDIAEAEAESSPGTTPASSSISSPASSPSPLPVATRKMPLRSRKPSSKVQEIQSGRAE